MTDDEGSVYYERGWKSGYATGLDGLSVGGVVTFNGDQKMVTDIRPNPDGTTTVTLGSSEPA